MSGRHGAGDLAGNARVFRDAREEDRPVLITGGAGFIGTNLADRLLSEGRSVLVYDNLSHPGSRENLRWLIERHPGRLQVEVADVRDRGALRRAVQPAAQVFHLAAQVGVRTSLADPISDFEINAGGALNLLEVVRTLPDPPPVVFTSTNRVYGALGDLRLVRGRKRYEPADLAVRACGIGEDRPLDFHSPHGCSKGAAEQYVTDYARLFGLPTVVLRMSSVYGPHQFGTEEQGWVAHFLIRAIEGEPITVYGDGMQVRDLLFVEDLVDGLLLAGRYVGALSGRAFNIGGGPDNTTSVLELIDMIAELKGVRPEVRFGEWRPGDPRYYVSNTTRFGAVTGWAPNVGVREGVERLYRWLLEARGS